MDKRKSILTEDLTEKEKFRPQDFKEPKKEMDNDQKELRKVLQKKLDSDHDTTKTVVRFFLVLIFLAIIGYSFYKLNDKYEWFDLSFTAEVKDFTISDLSKNELAEIISKEYIFTKDDEKINSYTKDYAFLSNDETIYGSIVDGRIYYNKSNMLKEVVSVKKEKVVDYFETKYGHYLISHTGKLYQYDQPDIITTLNQFSINDVLKIGSILEDEYLFVLTSNNNFYMAYYKDPQNWINISLGEEKLKNLKIIDYTCNYVTCNGDFGLLVNDRKLILLKKSGNKYTLSNSITIPEEYNVKTVINQYIWLKDRRILFIDYESNTLKKVIVNNEELFKLNDKGVFETKEEYRLQPRFDYNLINQIDNDFVDNDILEYGDQYIITTDKKVYIRSDKNIHTSNLLPATIAFGASPDWVYSHDITGEVYVISSSDKVYEVDTISDSEVKFNKINLSIDVKKIEMVPTRYPEIDTYEPLFYDYYEILSGINASKSVTIENSIQKGRYQIAGSKKLYFSKNPALFADPNMVGKTVTSPDEKPIKAIYSFLETSIFNLNGTGVQERKINLMRVPYYVLITEDNAYLLNSSFKKEELLLERVKTSYSANGAVILINTDDEMYSLGYNYNGQLLRSTPDDNGDGVMDFTAEIGKIRK